MKNVFFTLLLIVFAQSVLADEVATPKPIEKFSDNNVPFIYESRAKIPAASEKLAEYISVDYREAPDEFTKHELMENISPVLKSMLGEAKANNKYILRLGTQLGQYDFINKSFPTGLSSDSYIPFNRQHYAVVFENGNEIKNLPLPLDTAKTLSRMLQDSRDVTVLLLCKVVGTQEKKVSIWDMKIIKVKIEKALFMTNDEKAFGEIIPKL